MDGLKKRMLIIGIRMDVAGTEKSFLSFAKKINYEEYDVDLLLASEKGGFLHLVPREIKIKTMGKYAEIFEITRKNASSVIFRNFIKKNPFFAFSLLPYIIKMKKGEKERSFAANRMWLKLMSKMPVFSEEYDIALAYWGDHTMFYMIDKVKAVKKISWLHFDYDEPLREDALYLPYFRKCDKLVTVSTEIEKSLSARFPELADKIVTIENTIDIEDIKEKSLEYTDFCDKFEGLKIISVGRLCEQKGFDMAIEAIARICGKGEKLRYYILGDGDADYKQMLRSLAEKNNISENVVFLPETDNPYKYMVRCDIYLQPSRHEGKPISVEEAKALCLPICVTNYKSAHEQLKNGRLGMICEISSDGIYKVLYSMIFDKNKRDELKNALEKELKTVNYPICDLIL